MERIQLQGRAPTIRDHQRAGLSRFRSPSSPVDFNKLRADFDACMFVGPPTPLRLRRELSEEAESARYWRLVDEFQRWGWCELNEKGTPYFGDAFGN